MPKHKKQNDIANIQKKYQFKKKSYFCKKNIDTMNILDIILAVPLIYFVWKGYTKGLIYEVTALIGLVLGTYIAIRFSNVVCESLGLAGEGALLIAFFITFIGVLFLAHWAGKLMEGVLKMVKANFINHILGAIFGMLKCVCILSVICYYVSMIDSQEIFLTHNAKTESVLYQPINRTGNKVIGQLKVYVQKAHDKKSKETEVKS